MSRKEKGFFNKYMDSILRFRWLVIANQGDTSMPAFPRPKPSIDPVGHSTAPSARSFMVINRDYPELASDTTRQCVCCELHEGLPVIRQRVPSYYVSKPGEGPMLTLERKKGQRLRMCGTIDVIVLEIDNGEVALGICRPSDVVVGRCRP